MTTRTQPYANMSIVQPLIDFATAQEPGLDTKIGALVKIRASQINGCAVCLDMHTREALEAGEPAERLYNLEAWRELPLYDAREKAALGWTEALTRLSETRAPDDAYEAMAAHFSTEEQVRLTMAIGVINAFNMLGVGFRVRPVGARQKAA